MNASNFGDPAWFIADPEYKLEKPKLVVRIAATASVWVKIYTFVRCRPEMGGIANERLCVHTLAGEGYHS